MVSPEAFKIFLRPTFALLRDHDVYHEFKARQTSWGSVSTREHNLLSLLNKHSGKRNPYR